MIEKNNKNPNHNGIENFDSIWWYIEIVKKNSKMGLYTHLSGVMSENLVGAQDMRKFPTQSKLPS